MLCACVRCVLCVVCVCVCVCARTHTHRGVGGIGGKGDRRRRRREEERLRANQVAGVATGSCRSCTRRGKGITSQGAMREGRPAIGPGAAARAQRDKGLLRRFCQLLHRLVCSRPRRRLRASPHPPSTHTTNTQSNTRRQSKGSTQDVDCSSANLAPVLRAPLVRTRSSKEGGAERREV